MRDIQASEKILSEKNIEAENLRKKFEEIEMERKALDSTLSLERENWKKSLEERESIISEKNAQNARLYNELQSERKLKLHIQPEFEYNSIFFKGEILKKI